MDRSDCKRVPLYGAKDEPVAWTCLGCSELYPEEPLRCDHVDTLGDSEAGKLPVLKELEELRHFKDTSVGLWCVDQDPKEKSLDWIREHAFQLT